GYRRRIRTGELDENVGAVDEGGGKIAGGGDGEGGTKTIAPRVVGGFGSGQHVGVVKLRQAVQDLHEGGGAELGGSTRGLDLLRQPDRFVFHKLHRKQL